MLNFIHNRQIKRSNVLNYFNLGWLGPKKNYLTYKVYSTDVSDTKGVCSIDVSDTKVSIEYIKSSKVFSLTPANRGFARFVNKGRT